MTDRTLLIAKEWQNRPLERKYANVFMDAVHFHVWQDNQTVKKVVYVVIGVRLNGQKEVLGLWIDGNDGTQYLLDVLNKIRNRGVENFKSFMKELKKYIRRHSLARNWGTK